MNFTFYLNCWKKVKSWLLFHDTWKLHDIKIWVSLKFYWNTATLMCSCISMVLSRITTELWQRCYGLQKHELTHYLALYSKNFITFHLSNFITHILIWWFHYKWLVYSQIIWQKKWYHLKCVCVVVLISSPSLCFELFWELWWQSTSGSTEYQKNLPGLKGDKMAK